MWIHIQTLDSEQYFTDNGEDVNLDYGTGHYVSHPLSPFQVVTASADATVVESYADLQKAGLAFSENSRMVQLDPIRYVAGTPITLTVNTKDIFDTNLVSHMLDPMASAANELVLIDFFNNADSCIDGS